MTINQSIRKATQTGAAVAALTVSVLTVLAQQENWQDKAISPVANPIYFEDPRITTEVRPIFIQHWLPDAFHYYNDGGAGVSLGGDVRVYAVQLRYALTDRLGLIATKDGYIEFKPEGALNGAHGYGWVNLAAGLKYALVDDRENELLITPGFTFEIPTGDTRVLQGGGKGEWNPFVSAAKGFGNFHITGNLGARIPNDFDKQTAQFHYSLQLDYYTCQYFIPFFVVNANTVLSEGNQRLAGSLDLNTEMYDLINFGSTKAKGETQVTVGGGFRSKLTKNLDIGVAYEAGVTKPVGIFESRVTADMIWHF